MKTSLMEI